MAGSQWLFTNPRWLNVSMSRPWRHTNSECTFGTFWPPRVSHTCCLPGPPLPRTRSLFPLGTVDWAPVSGLPRPPIPPGYLLTKANANVDERRGLDFTSNTFFSSFFFFLFFRAMIGQRAEFVLNLCGIKFQKKFLFFRSFFFFFCFLN